MPNKLTMESLQAEAAGLAELLEEARGLGDIVGELQYQERLQEISDQLTSLANSKSKHASVALFFGGKPVFGTRGIAAEFAGRALETYQDLIAKAFARLEIGTIGARGPTPMKAATDLMITGVTHGSFGFVLEELSDQEELQETALHEVMSEVSDLLVHTSALNDSEFEGAADQIDARTLISLREFFKRLDSDEATLRIVENDREFRLDSAAVHRGRVRTEATQIDEQTQRITGVLAGFLPDHRRFEMRENGGSSIYGSVTKSAADQFVAAVGHGQIVIGNQCDALVVVREVRPFNRPPRLTYRLLGFHRIGTAEGR